MFDTRDRGYVAQRVSLGHLVLHALLERGRHGKDAVDAGQRRCEAGLVGEIAGHELDSELTRRAGALCVGVARETTYAPAVSVQAPRHRPALLTGDAGDQDGLVAVRTHSSSLATHRGPLPFVNCSVL